jgi:DmsE family decaheme c-type cytochrome
MRGAPWRLTILAWFSSLPVRTLPAQATSTPQPTYEGSAACLQCHEQQFESLHQTAMGRQLLDFPRTETEKLGCEACHGPASVHIDSGGGRVGVISFRRGAEPVARQNAPCLACHENGDRTFWRGSPHESRNIACVDCHRIMAPVSEEFALARPTVTEVCTQCHHDREAQAWRSSHMPVREGRMTCANCHNPHGSPGEKLLRQASVNENCYSCHAEKRGPFLWEHAPVRENCLNCHDPHGSIHERLLKVKRPRLCQQCHTEQFHPSTPTLPTSRIVFNRSCQNCHPMIHGSNHPSGMLFQR